MSNLAKVGAALFVAAELAIFVFIGVDSLSLLAGWALAAVIVGLCGWLIRRTTLGVVGAALLIPACLVLVTWLGLFFLPSAVVLLVSAVRSQRRQLSVPTTIPHHAQTSGLSCG
jgi:putative effector of murein hydrolase LrgA (UPF0299 family)